MPITSLLLDRILGLYMVALDGVYAALTGYSLLLLGAFALIYITMSLWPVVMGRQ